MFKVGITGGIGSGKSTVAKVFETFGIPVYYADEAAKRLMVANEDLKTAITQLFGAASYIHGKLNTAYLSAQVFHDHLQLEKLNALVHPAVINDSQNWLQRQTAAYAIKEAALLFESGSAAELDYIIGVFTPVPLRIQRTIQRDAASREEIMMRMQKQIDETIKMRLCDTIIYNDEQQLVIPQVQKIHLEILSRLEQQNNANV